MRILLIGTIYEATRWVNCQDARVEARRILQGLKL